jgi:AraC family transcriptional regulator
MNERLQAIHTAIKFIESNLVEPIKVADIAAVAGYSLYYFIRSFNQTVRHTPYDYLMRRRLTEAARLLLASDRKVIDIAFEFQFNNHETFTRAFKRLFRMTPTHWREQGYDNPRILMPAFDLDFLSYLNGPELSPPQVQYLDEIILAGLMSPLRVDSDHLSALWKDLKDALPLQSPAPGTYDFWGIRFPPKKLGGACYYMAAYKITSIESVPSRFAAKVIPAGEYLCLSLPATTPDLDQARMFLFHVVMPKSHYDLPESLEIEHLGDTKALFVPVKRSLSKL